MKELCKKISPNKIPQGPDTNDKKQVARKQIYRDMCNTFKNQKSEKDSKFLSLWNLNNNRKKSGKHLESRPKKYDKCLQQFLLTD